MHAVRRHALVNGQSHPREATSQTVGMPADGAIAATAGNGDFGTSPFFGQLLDEPQLASINLHGAQSTKHNGEGTIYIHCAPLPPETAETLPDGPSCEVFDA